MLKYWAKPKYMSVEKKSHFNHRMKSLQRTYSNFNLVNQGLYIFFSAKYAPVKYKCEKKEFCFEVTAMACVVNSTSKGKRRVSQKIFLVPQVK